MGMSNTVKRILVSVLFIPLIIAAAYFGSIIFLLFISIVGIISYYELSLLAKKKNASILLNSGMAYVFLIILTFYLKFPDLSFVMLIIVTSVFVIELFRNNGSPIINSAVTLMSILYIGLFMGSVIGIREFYHEPDYINGGYLIIAIFASIWLCDSAAFFGGTAFGKHKLFPRVSPNKSWEGAIFGFVFAVAGMLLGKYTVLNFLTITDVIVIGVIIGTIGQIGDLVESLIKRDVQVKDSSNLIPGHGGLLDRFDSLLFVAPSVFIYLNIISR